MSDLPTAAAIAKAQDAYERGEMSLLEATFYAEALSDMGPQDRAKAADRPNTGDER